MKIEMLSLMEIPMTDCGYQDRIEIRFDGKCLFSVHDGEPEDNNLSRNFNSCYGILDLLKKAYEVGKRGENLEIISTEVDEL